MFSFYIKVTCQYSIPKIYIVAISLVRNVVAKYTRMVNKIRSLTLILIIISN